MRSGVARIWCGGWDTGEHRRYGIPKNLKWSICGIANMLERCRYRGVTELAVGITEARAYGSGSLAGG